MNRFSNIDIRPLRYWISTAVSSFGLAVIFAAAVAAQTPTPTSDDEPIKVDTLLINIPLVVSDAQGRYVGGLKKQDFFINLDGEKQEIEYFADAEAPVSVAIILDMSGSTMSSIKAIKGAAQAFVDKLNPSDQAALITFDQLRKIDIVTQLTSDRKKLSGKIGSLKHNFSGRLVERNGRETFPDMYDAIHRVMKKEFANVKGRKAIIVLTDGFVVGRTVTEKDFDDTIIAGETVIYPVMFLTRQHLGPGNGTTITYADLYKLPVTTALDHVASKTGGRLIIAARDTDFQSSFQSVGDELRKQYILGFHPSNLNEIKTGKIGLGVVHPGMKVRSKSVIRLKPPVEPSPGSSPRK